MERTFTNRGFAFIAFNDRYDVPCCIQESSLATEPAIWLGIQEAQPKILANKINPEGTGWLEYRLSDDVMINTRMHLTQENAKELVKVLNRFIETGHI